MSEVKCQMSDARLPESYGGQVKCSPMGFTLAELVVVVIVLGILGTMSFRTYLDMIQRQEFDNALNMIVEMIQTARNDAVTSHAVYTTDQPTTPVIPPEGYGVYLNLTPPEGGAQVIVFANTSADTREKASQFDPDDLILDGFKLAPSVVFDKLFKLEAGQTVAPDAGIEAGAEAVILFKPPFAETFISNNKDPADVNNSIDTLSIQLLGRNDPTHKKVITIDQVSGVPAIHL